MAATPERQQPTTNERLLAASQSTGPTAYEISWVLVPVLRLWIRMCAAKAFYSWGDPRILSPVRLGTQRIVPSPDYAEFIGLDLELAD